MLKNSIFSRLNFLATPRRHARHVGRLDEIVQAEGEDVHAAREDGDPVRHDVRVRQVVHMVVRVNIDPCWKKEPVMLNAKKNTELVAAATKRREVHDDDSARSPHGEQPIASVSNLIAFFTNVER